MKITPRTAITLTFIAFGMVMGGQIGSIPAIKIQAGLDEFAVGLTATLATLATVMAMSTSGFVNRYFDHRAVLLIALPLSLASLFLTTTASSFLIYAITWILLSLCGGIIDVFMNAEAGIIEHDVKKPIFASFHAAVLYAMGASGFISGYIAQNYGILYTVLPSLPFCLAAIYAVYHAIPHRKPEVRTKTTVREPLPVKVLVLIGIVLGLDVAAELTCIQWSGQLLAAMRPDLASYSGLAILFYGLCSGTIRLVGDGLRARFGDLKVVLTSFAVGLTGFCILSLHPSFLISVIAFALVGMGLGLVFPCMFAIAAHAAPQARASALGLASMVGGPPRILFPMFLGFMAQSYGLSSIFLVGALGLIAAAGFTVWVGREMKRA